MVGSLQGQVEAQRESQHVVHADQEQFMIKLQSLKAKLESI
jgi:hypothetical protein